MKKNVSQCSVGAELSGVSKEVFSSSKDTVWNNNERTTGEKIGDHSASLFLLLLLLTLSQNSHHAPNTFPGMGLSTNTAPTIRNVNLASKNASSLNTCVSNQCCVACVGQRELVKHTHTNAACRVPIHFHPIVCSNLHSNTNRTHPFTWVMK